MNKGDKYGRLTAVEYSHTKKYSGSSPQTKPYWVFACECGNKKIAPTGNVRRGQVSSCGCLALETRRSIRRTHGMTDTRIYRIWSGLFRRINPKNPKLDCYKGVVVSDRWNRFENFYEDMGEPPTDRHEIDRVDPYGDYTPENCRWATRSEQMLNQKRNYKLYQSYKSFDAVVDYATFARRVKRNKWTHEKAATQPKMKNQFA